ncbi:MutS2 family protein [Amphibacillus marinus]|uniref:MutS2 family protein n=1 Tax=Amphibacillus marinus TaxID=872970 RepID=A0A1H8KBS8_9BACI|nr:DNA mismatch repair protein [Amphibacillus marinus]SEN90384.1 MutS2 family protein [Amphibacillus marinus]
MQAGDLAMLGYNEVVQELSKYAHTERAKQALLDLKPSMNKNWMVQSMNEIEEAIAILQQSASVPIHTVDELTTMLKQAAKGIFIRADQMERVLSFLDHCRKLSSFMKKQEWRAPIISSFVYSVEEFSELEAQINKAIRHGQVDDYASKDLSYLRRQKGVLTDRLKGRITQMAKGSKYATFLQERTVTERSGHYVLAVKKEYRHKVKGTILDQSASGATLFIEPAELGGIQEEINLLQLSEQAEVERILFEVTAAIMEREHAIKTAIEVMYNYDLIFAKAKYCREINGTKPRFSDQHKIRLVDARHPALGANAVPLSVTFGQHDHALVITGPNTGGKTVTIKTIGLLTVMAQSGLLIPAEHGSELTIFQHVFVDIGDGQSIVDNLSTFSSRLVSIIDILQQANDHSLVLLDELGSGTDPGEGMGLAIAILKQLFNKGATILATTHYSEVKSFADQAEGFINAAMAFDLDTLKPTYQLLLGETGQSQAFEIALKLGLHPALIEQAHILTYGDQGDYHSRCSELELKSESFARQVATNRYAGKKKRKAADQVALFSQGDNVTIQATDETAIVYQGPDQLGNYIVQVKGEKLSINHKRLKLTIAAEELYPPGYDFDIIFKSKAYRKIKKDQGRKYLEDVWLEDED